MTATDKYWLHYEFRRGEYDQDILVALLTDLPCLGIIEKESSIDVYFNTENAGQLDRQIRQILKFYPEKSIAYQRKLLKNRDWHLSWQKYFKPIRVSSGIVIYPAWETYTGNEAVQIAIQPGMAFGTGTHATTQMALTLLEKTIRPGMTVLDAGCGSGILSIAALKLGAGFVEAWDIDPDIQENFHRQLELNGIHDRFSLVIGDVTQHSSNKYNLILSNIERKPNLALLSNHAKYGHIPPCIFTGILKDEYNMFKSAVLNYDLIVKEEMFRDEWVALLTEKK